MTSQPNGEKRRRFAVVGAGASGLAVLQVFADELKDELALGDCEIACFERRDDSGGICEPNPPLAHIPDTPLYDALTTNLPMPIMTFLSHGIEPSTEIFPHAIEIKKYLDSYEKRFDLRRFISFNTLVAKAFWDEHVNKWELTIQRTGQPESSHVEYFDHLLVTNGHYGKPYVPAFEGLDEWSAHESRKVIHSMWYREPSPYQDLRVLVIGGGPSGNDIAADISSVAKETIQSVRSFEDERIGQIIHRGHIDRFTADGLVIFKSGKEAAIDRVILATGYKYDFPFLPQLPLRAPEPDSTSLYNSASHIYPLAQHLFPLLAPFPPTSLAFFGLPSKVAPFPLFEVQALLAARLMTGRIAMDFDQELVLTRSRNRLLLSSHHDSAQAAARFWHVLDGSGLQYDHREHLWNLAGEPDRKVPAWTREFYDKKFILRDEWRELVKSGEAASWVEGVGKGGMQEWVDLLYRLLRRVESRKGE
ncbi:FAD/NAD(P)-binding domain-containing protein [Ceratobasidium sp. AG-I]|nr:FAD/NAD(P)-binding domain-containing protein [Ceratobasidium sp. AG-I]